MRMLLATAALLAGFAFNFAASAQAEECTGDQCSQQQDQQGGHDCHRKQQQITS